MRLYSPNLSVNYHKVSLRIRQSILLSLTSLLMACSAMTPMGTPKGAVSAPDEMMRSAGADVLQKGGNAADAMSAMLMTGAVVIPSRMGLGASGICQVLDPTEGRVKTLDFMGRSMSFDRKIATPGMARGVYTLQNKYGRKRWVEIMKPMGDKAQKGIVVSEQLSKDIIMTPGLPAAWKKLKKGDKLAQPELAQTMRTLAAKGAGVLYNGDMASSLVSQSDQIVKEDLKNFKASFMDSIDVTEAGSKTFFPNPTVLPSDAYMIWRCAQPSNGADRQQKAIDDMKKIENRMVHVNEQVQGVGLISADKSGLIVACSISMGKPFGTKQMTEEGFFLGNVVSKEDQGAAFANFIQTNADVTDATQVLVGVGDYALVDGMNAWSEYCQENKLLNVTLSDDRKEDLKDFGHLKCEKGYPNQPSSCDAEKGLSFVYQKND